MIAANRVCQVLGLLIVSSFASQASAMLITNISGLVVDGTSYDVTFHAGQSFNELWDGNGDGTFESDGSVFNEMPTFWNNEAGAAAAALALIAFFPADGSFGTAANDAAAANTCGQGMFCDGFAIPVQFHPTGPSAAVIVGDLDPAPALINDTFVSGQVVETSEADVGGGFFPYASFARSTTVPEPATMALMGLGLAGIGWSQRKRA